MSEKKPPVHGAIKSTKKEEIKVETTTAAPSAPTSVATRVDAHEPNNYALIGFIISLFGMVIPGAVLSTLGIVKAKEKGGKGTGFGVAGLVISGLWVIVWIVIMFALLLIAKQYEASSR